MSRPVNYFFGSGGNDQDRLDQSEIVKSKLNPNALDVLDYICLSELGNTNNLRPSKIDL